MDGQGEEERLTAVVEINGLGLWRQGRTEGTVGRRRSLSDLAHDVGVDGERLGEDGGWGRRGRGGVLGVTNRLKGGDWGDRAERGGGGRREKEEMDDGRKPRETTQQDTQLNPLDSHSLLATRPISRYGSPTVFPLTRRFLDSRIIQHSIPSPSISSSSPSY